jgi:hypothetical protein
MGLVASSVHLPRGRGSALAAPDARSVHAIRMTAVNAPTPIARFGLYLAVIAHGLKLTIRTTTL